MMTTTAQPIAYSVAEAAEALRISLRKMEDLVASGAVPTFRIGRRRLIRRSDLEAFVDRHVQPSRAA
jgi:excisionase family DNA binding protein